MSTFYNVLHKALGKRDDYCNLCFKTIEGEQLNFVDVIVSNDNQTIKDVLLDVLGNNIINSLSTSEIICISCFKSALNCQSFIKMCKLYSEQICEVYKTLNLAVTQIDPSDLLEVKSIFIGINDENSVIKQYYDVQRSVKNRLSAIKRYCMLAKIKPPKINEEILESNEYSDEINKKSHTKSAKGKQRLQHVDSHISIPLRDMLHDPTQKDSFACKICHKTCKTAQLVKHHYLRMHIPKTFECNMCSSTFTSSTFLQLHIRQNHGKTICSKCGEVCKNVKALRNHDLVHSGKLVCPSCCKQFRSEEGLFHHIKNKNCQLISAKADNESNNIYSCYICSETFTDKEILLSHMKFNHIKDKAQYSCKWCVKRFDNPSALKVHVLKHTKEKNYTCDVCGGRFINKSSLVHHTRIHTGEKPFQCEYCDQTFLSKSRRLDHVKRHHWKLTRECDICHRVFKDPFKFKKHRLNHFDPNNKLYVESLVVPNT